MSSQEATWGSVTKLRNREFCTKGDGTDWTRKINSDGSRTEWEQVVAEPESEPPALFLSLILENQATGEPRHWSLFVAEEGQPGNSYSVTGDATWMTYAPAQNNNIMASESFYTSYTLCQLGKAEEDWVRHCAQTEPPPKAQDRASVIGNCQGWTIRVLKRLQAQGIVGEEWIAQAEQLLDPV